MTAGAWAAIGRQPQASNGARTASRIVQRDMLTRVDAEQNTTGRAWLGASASGMR
jgi:hypothetical protein